MSLRPLPLCRMLFPVLVCVAFLLPREAEAQFDLDNLKKKAEKVITKDKDASKEETKESEVDEEAAAKTRERQEMQRKGTFQQQGNQEAEEMLRKAHYAVQPLLDIRSVYEGMLTSKREAQAFHDKCRDADYANSRKAAEEAVAMDPDLKRRTGQDFDDVVTRLPEHMKELVNEYLVKEINAAIETAYAEKAKGETHAGAALEAAEAAWLTADGVLLVLPGHQRITELRADAEAAKQSMGAAMEAVYTGEFHRAHAGEIVFSSSPIVAGSENASAIGSAFTPSDRIYGMMYFKGTYNEATGGSNVAHTILLVDDNQMVSYVFKLEKGAGEQSWLKSEILPDPAQSTTRGALLFTEKLKDISPRRHRIPVRTTDDYNKTIAEGSFTLDCSGGTEPIAALHSQLGAKKLSAVSLPSPAMKNAKLEKEMMAALGAWEETPLKVIITDRDWTIQHHPVTGAIVSRTINTTTVFKKADGNCRMFEISYRQQYAGGKYGKAQQYGVGDSADVLCEKVK